MKKKKKTRKKLDGLELKKQPRHRKGFIDYDYLDQLTKEEKEFLGKFTDEYYGGGGFERGEDDDFDYTDSIHNTDELRRDCYRRNKRQQRCAYNRAAGIGNLFLNGANNTLAKEEEDNLNIIDNYEDNLIELINAKDMLEAKELKKIEKAKSRSKHTKNTSNKSNAKK